ncbi:MAG: hypothetical protein Q7T86_07380 [Hyphomicrobiaceae bacterium]|nr:hypothetical protein [Hyphomicrobiaceae bacterium]
MDDTDALARIVGAIGADSGIIDYLADDGLLHLAAASDQACKEQSRALAFPVSRNRNGPTAPAIPFLFWNMCEWAWPRLNLASRRSRRMT